MYPPAIRALDAIADAIERYIPGFNEEYSISLQTPYFTVSFPEDCFIASDVRVLVEERVGYLFQQIVWPGEKNPTDDLFQEF